MTKVCCTCKEEKPFKDFGKYTASEDGYRKQCKKCRSYDKHWKNGLLKCTRCKIYKEVSAFPSNSKKINRDYKDSRCTVCKAEASAERRIQRYKCDPLDRILVERVSGARVRAKNSNTYFDITVDDVKTLWELQKGKCAISGISMTYSLGEGRVPTNISIDQISPSKGYTIDNIQLVCMAVNQMKSDLSIEELLSFCKSIVENAKKWDKG